MALKTNELKQELNVIGLDGTEYRERRFISSPTRTSEPAAWRGSCLPYVGNL
jgi:hypothetical protein